MQPDDAGLRALFRDEAAALPDSEAFVRHVLEDLAKLQQRQRARGLLPVLLSIGTLVAGSSALLPAYTALLPLLEQTTGRLGAQLVAALQDTQPLLPIGALLLALLLPALIDRLQEF